MNVPGASEDSGSGQGFLFHSRAQWIHLLGRYLAQPSHWRTGPSLHVPSNSTQHQQTCTQSAIEGKQAGLSLRGKEYNPVFDPFTWCSNFRWAEWCVEDKNIYQEKEICVLISVGFSVNKPFHHFQISFPPGFTVGWRIYISLNFLSATPLWTFLHLLFPAFLQKKSNKLNSQPGVSKQSVSHQAFSCDACTDWQWSWCVESNTFY